MRINVAVPEAHVDAPVLDAALESVTRLNESLLARKEIPTFERGLKERGIQWAPEPPGQEHFDHGHTVMKRGKGDCDDLAPWHAASLRHTGEDPDARAIVYKSGPKRWHAVVERGDGSIDDPSKRAGMGQPRGNRGATLPSMPGPAVHGVGAYEIRPQVALRPLPGGWQARADIPWQYLERKAEAPMSDIELAMTSLHASPVASQALVGAIDGAIELAECGGFADPEHINRLECLADACEGADYEELAGEYGEDAADAAMAVVGSFWGGLAKTFKKVAPFASKAISFIPGIGPVASTALDVATKFIPDQKPRGHGVPGGPGLATAMSAFMPGGGPAAPMFGGGMPQIPGVDPRMFQAFQQFAKANPQAFGFR